MNCLSRCFSCGDQTQYVDIENPSPEGQSPISAETQKKILKNAGAAMFVAGAVLDTVGALVDAALPHETTPFYLRPGMIVLMAGGGVTIAGAGILLISWVNQCCAKPSVNDQSHLLDQTSHTTIDQTLT